MVRTPIYYAGKKEGLLPQILQVFPSDIDNFVDVFAGSCSVGVNVNANHIHMIDSNHGISLIFSYIQNTPFETIKNEIEKIIEENKGLKTKEDYYIYRAKVESSYSSADLLVLICCCFCNQMRFNKDGKFNSPYGDRMSYKTIIQKIKEFQSVIKVVTKYHFYESDYKNFIFNILPFLCDKDLIYLDPPYLGAVAVYNSLWEEKDDDELVDILKEIDKKGVKFALSNNTNYNPLIVKKMSSFNVVNLSWDYNNANYHKKKRNQFEGEIIIKNY